MKSIVCSIALLLCLIPCPLITQAQSKVKTINVTFTTIDVPGAGYTGVLGINSAGDVVGDYGQDLNTDAHGFEYSNGAFTYFDYPNNQGHTIPTGVMARGRQPVRLAISGQRTLGTKSSTTGYTGLHRGTQGRAPSVVGRG